MFDKIYSKIVAVPSHAAEAAVVIPYEAVLHIAWRSSQSRHDRYPWTLLAWPSRSDETVVDSYVAYLAFQNQLFARRCQVVALVASGGERKTRSWDS